MTNIEEAICEAIDIISEKAIAEAGYDKTIQGIIISCVDESTGKYKVRYQDSTFYAYAEDLDLTYTAGTSVYVLVPGNDMSNDKVILGSTKKLGTNYVATAEGDAAYEVVGSNVADSDDTTFTFSSYKAGIQTIVLYSKNNPDEANLIDVDQFAAKEYFSSAEVIICGGVIRTALPAEQQSRGNYGIIFSLDFADNATGETVTRSYWVDVDVMTGNPYKLIYDTRQYGIFDIDGENFLDINNISLFCYDFPHTLPDEECIDDIFISGIEISGANRISGEDLDNYSLTFQTLKGTFFTADSLDTDTLTIEAILRVKSKVVDDNNIDFYWFTEDVGVTSSSRYYCSYGGRGWRCLNDYNVIDGVEESEDAIVEWVPAGAIWTVTKADIFAEEVTYKCVAVYDGEAVSKTIVIKNYDSDYVLEIESDQGTQFYYDIGNPTLTCYVKHSDGEERDISNCSFSWGVTNNVGSFSSLAETTSANEEYQEILDEYNSLLQDVEDEKTTVVAAKDTLELLKKELNDYEYIMRVQGNCIYHVDISSIVSWSTYKCTVYDQEKYVGTTSITLLNTYETVGQYTLIINNGTKLYKYDENGLSPASRAAESPISLQALTFTVFDNLGQPIDDDIIQNCEIQWTVPTSNTLLEVPDGYSPTSISIINGTATYGHHIMSFSYNIADRYDITKTRNNIYLSVEYQGVTLTARTNFTFTKEGESGTNGTEYTVRIVPNVQSGDLPEYWIVTQSSTGRITHNFAPDTTNGQNRYLKVQLFHNEDLIYDGVIGGTSDEGQSVAIVWEMLCNTYTSSYKDTCPFTVNAATGAFSTSSGDFGYSGYTDDHPANIVKAAVVYEGVTNYATFPIITVKMSNDDYILEPVEGAGFQYAIYTSDGRTPKYDNVNPFEVTTWEITNDGEEDVSTKTSDEYKVDYNWDYLGRIYSYISSGWEDSGGLVDRKVYGTVTAQNQKWVKPADVYDGQSVTNAVRCVVTKGGNEIGRMLIPVHSMLNRYGLSALNDWDGNSIVINGDEGFILAPQVGAGAKDESNRFTGVIIGEVKESGYTTTDTGLIGYSHGARSMFLDAETGKSEFGVDNHGKIVIDPSSGDTATAQIYSGSWPDSGLCIDLEAPSITYANGHFSVDKDGNLVATGPDDGEGVSQIAGWWFDSDSLWSDNKTKSRATTRMASADFSTTINGQSVSKARLYFNGNFGVDSDGKMYAASGVIGNGSNKITIGQGSSSASAVYSGNKTSYSATGSGFYLGTDGFSLGNNFSVDPSGSLTAKDGTIGGWEINSSTLSSSSGNITLNSNGSMEGGTSYDWYIHQNGEASFSNINLAGRSITSILNSLDDAVYNLENTMSRLSSTIDSLTTTQNELAAAQNELAAAQANIKTNTTNITNIINDLGDWSVDSSGYWCYQNNRVLFASGDAVAIPNALMVNGYLSANSFNCSGDISIQNGASLTLTTYGSISIGSQNSGVYITSSGITIGGKSVVTA